MGDGQAIWELGAKEIGSMAAGQPVGDEMKNGLDGARVRRSATNETALIGRTKLFGKGTSQNSGHICG
jgi:hypothetical protein